MEKGMKVELEIEDMSTEGQGIGRTDGLAVFVDKAVLGDTVVAELVKVKKNYAFGKLIEVKKPSDFRIDIPCKYYDECGGCRLQNISYEGQLILKKKMVNDKLERLGGIGDPKINDTIGMEKPYHYRNKAQLPISCGGLITRKGGMQENLGECAIGFYKAKSHEVVNCKECLIQAEPALVAAQVVREYMDEENLTAWDPKWEKGLMRHVIVKTGFNTGEVMVIIVMNAKNLPNSEKFITKLNDAINDMPHTENGVTYSLECVATSTHRKKTSSILGEPCVTIAGKPVIEETIGRLTFEISPASFYQVNPVQTVKLLDLVAKYADLTGSETVLDLYCGVGTIGLYLSNKAGHVVGIESVKEAVLNANRNAVINGIVNAEYICGKVEIELPNWLSQSSLDTIEKAHSADTHDGDIADINKKIDLVILDPPRSGCYPQLLETVAKAAPAKIIYVSCDPATLARDIKILIEKGYEFVEATPVDMFPQTMCVETVVLLSHKNS